MSRASCSVLRASCVAFCVAMTLPVFAATTYYVDADKGDDSYDGKSPTVDGPGIGPKLTVEAGIACLKAKKDELVLAPGTYAVTNDMTVLPSYDALVIRGADPDRTKTVLTGSGQYRGFQTSHNQNFRNLTFSNFYNTVKSKTTAASIHFATWNNCTVSNCWFVANTNACESGVECGGIVQCSSLAPKFNDCLFELNATPNSYGGAVCHMGGVNTVWTLSNCVFRANSAKYGGAAYFNKSTPAKCQNCLFADNRSSDSGGAFRGQGTLTDCVFTNNLSAGSAGVVYPTAGCTFRRCTFVDNVATNSGGVFCNGNDRGSWFYDCTFLRNRSVTGSGGAFFAVSINCGAPGNWVNLVSNCTFTANSATNGSGGAINGLTLQLKDCKFYDNRAKGNGGAVTFADYYATTVHTLFHCVSNCTFVGNEIVRPSAGGCGGALDVNAQTNFMVAGCTFQNNAVTNFSAVAAQDSKAYNAGGALYSALPIYLHDCQFVSNAATHAGGAFFGNATGGVLRCTFVGNRTDYDASAAYVPGAGSAIAFERGRTTLASATENCWWNFLEDCVFSNNFCRGTGTTIYSTRGGLRMKRCDFVGNEGRMDTSKPWYMFSAGVVAYRYSGYIHYGGAADGYDYCTYTGNRTILQMDSCRFIGNKSVGMGGAVNAYFLSNFDDRHPKSYIRNCLFADTTLAKAALGQTTGEFVYNGKGGAILLGKTSEVSVENCTFVNNVAEIAGGAIADPGESNRIVNCVFHGNVDAAAGRETDNFSITDVTTVSSTLAPDDGVLTDGVNDCIVTDDDFLQSDDHTAYALKSPWRGKSVLLDWMTPDSLDCGGKPRLAKDGSVDMGCYQFWRKPGLLLFVQ